MTDLKHGLRHQTELCSTELEIEQAEVIDKIAEALELHHIVASINYKEYENSDLFRITLKALKSKDNQENPK